MLVEGTQQRKMTWGKEGAPGHKFLMEGQKATKSPVLSQKDGFLPFAVRGRGRGCRDGGDDGRFPPHAFPWDRMLGKHPTCVHFYVYFKSRILSSVNMYITKLSFVASGKRTQRNGTNVNLWNFELLIRHFKN